MEHALTPEAFLVQVAQQAWDLFKRDALLMIVSGFLVAVCGALTLGLLVGPLMVGLILMIRARRRGEPASIGDVFHFDHFVSSVLAVLIVGVAAGLGLLLLVVPGVLVMVMCAFTLHTIAYRGLGAVDAIKASYTLVRAHFIHVLGLIIVLSLLNALANAVVVAGIVTGPLSVIALTVGYELLAGVPVLPRGDVEHAPSE